MKHTKLVFTILLSISGFFNKANAQTLFSDDFENGLTRWSLRGSRSISLIAAGAEHGHALKLKSEGLVYALIKGSEKWGPVAVMGQFMFPDSSDNYLGFIYNETEKSGRVNFGSVYIKGNDSYIRVNPFRDGNASRLLYEEYRVPLTGEAKIIAGKWHNFKMEVWQQVCHLYVDNMLVPKITFNHYEGSSGKIGFQPRVAGFPVLLDNIRVERIKQLSYTGADIPIVSYKTENLVTNWETAGPFSKSVIALEDTPEPLNAVVKNGSKQLQWKKLETDKRGAVITGSIVDFEGPNRVAYFRTIINADRDKRAALHFSTADELGIFLNGIFLGYVYRKGYGHKKSQDWNAWFDFTSNKEHEGNRFFVDLKKGENILMLKVQGGQFASGGFFLAVE